MMRTQVGAQREFMRAHCVDTPWSIRAQRDYIVENEWNDDRPHHGLSCPFGWEFQETDTSMGYFLCV
jgi:hypothetical protein